MTAPFDLQYVKPKPTKPRAASETAQVVKAQMVRTKSPIPKPSVLKKAWGFLKLRKADKTSHSIVDSKETSKSYASSVSSSRSSQLVNSKSKPAQPQSEEQRRIVIPKQAFNPHGVEFYSGTMTFSKSYL